VYFAAELRILLVYLSESLGNQNGGTRGPHFSLGGGDGPPVPRRTAPGQGLLLLHWMVMEIEETREMESPKKTWWDCVKEDMNSFSFLVWTLRLRNSGD